MNSISARPAARISQRRAATRVISIAHTAVKRSNGRLRYHPLQDVRDIECHLVTPARWREFGRDFVADPADDPGVALHVEPIRLAHAPVANWYLHYYPGLGKLIRGIAPDVIHLWEEPWSVVASQALRLRDRWAPQASLILEVDQNILKRLPPPFEQMRRRVLQRTDLLLVRSLEAEQVARASGFNGPAMQIGYGVDRTGFAPRDRAQARAEFGLSGFTIGYVGRIVAAKGLDDAIEALARASAPVTLAIMGEGPHLARIKARASALGVADRLRCFGWGKPDAVARFMSAVDSLILLTRTTNAVREQFGRVIIEAQSCGTPVIGSECGAIPNVVGDGGWIIPERSPDELASLLDELAGKPDMIRRAGALGMAQVRSRFTYESVAATLVDAWRLSRTGEQSTRRPVMEASCPICRSNDARLARRFSSKEVAQHYVRTEIDPERHAELLAHVEKLWGRTGCEWLDCAQCGFGYATPFVAGDATFYELASGNTPYPKWKWEFQRTLKRLRETRIAQARTGRLLEVGAGDGHLLQALGAAGWPKSAMLGLEYSSSGLAAMGRKNIPCRAVDVRDLAIEGPFDVMCLFQVLEHLDRLDLLFDRLGALAAPGADLFIGVPNGDWQRANEVLGTCDDFPPNHVSRWSPANFEMVARRFGWRVEAIELEPIGRRQAARYAFAERFLRESERPGSMANGFMRAASRVPGKSPARALKAIGAGLQAACWTAALDRFAFDSPSPNIWAHFSRAE